MQCRMLLYTSVYILSLPFAVLRLVPAVHGGYCAWHGRCLARRGLHVHVLHSFESSFHTPCGCFRLRCCCPVRQ